MHQVFFNPFQVDWAIDSKSNIFHYIYIKRCSVRFAQHSNSTESWHPYALLYEVNIIDVQIMNSYSPTGEYLANKRMSQLDFDVAVKCRTVRDNKGTLKSDMSSQSVWTETHFKPPPNVTQYGILVKDCNSKLQPSGGLWLRNVLLFFICVCSSQTVTLRQQNCYTVAR